MFPPDVALPVGGPAGHRIVLLELHYDNPTLQAGMETRVYT